MNASIREYIQNNLDRYTDELTRFVSIPSVSSQGTGIEECARFVRDALVRRGIDARIISTAGNPIVFGELGSGDRTLLLYNHYDVQPAEPLDLWTTPPFEPVVRDGALYGRGAIDDKGEIIARLAAIDALLAAHKELPLKVKFLVEGEEESGSANLEPFIIANRDLLGADACIWEAGMTDDEGHPMVWLGVRGLLYVELTVRTLAHDAHSGWAHALPNAAWRLTRALLTLKDEDERILIDGFYDDVVVPTKAQQRLLEQMLPEDDNYRREYKIDHFVGRREGLKLRNALFLPTCNISGLWSGYSGEGAKTVIPSEAKAKLDFRLVPNQVPNDLVAKLRNHFVRHGFADVEITPRDGQRAGVCMPDHPFVSLAIAVAERTHGKPTLVAPIVGGTGPAAYVLEHLRAPFVSIGCSYPGGRKHAPDENIRLADFVIGATCIANLLEAFAREPAIQAREES